MQITRRDTLKGFAGGLLGAAGGLASWPSFAAAKELTIDILGFSLAIHIPAMAALNEGLPALGDPKPKLTRINSMRVLTQTIVAGSADVGESDVVSALRATEAGADLKIVGLVYANTSQVYLANTQKAKSIADFGKGGLVAAVNSKGDFTHIMLVGPLVKHGIDPAKVTIVEIGGSGGRVAALKAGRVDSVPVHLDQARQLMAEQPGRYAIVIEPWKEFENWISEVWITPGSWLADAENERALVDMLKAVVTSFRRANKDFPYFVESYRKYATITGAASAAEDSLRDIWQALSTEARAWPDDGGMKRSYFEEMLPIWKAAGGVAGTVDINKVVEPKYLEQALKELSA